MSQAAESYAIFLKTFETALQAAGRKIDSVQLLPVSKGQSLEKLSEFLALSNFPQALAENYLEELARKAPALPSVDWHYQGALQSRKIADILQYATYVQSVSRVKELELIRKNSPAKFKGFFIQMNISSEGQKLGASESEALDLLAFIEREKMSVLFCGFMGVASDLSLSNEVEVRQQFARLRKFRDQHAPDKKLSMGMSADFHLAIAEGADLVRVGSSLFGSRG